jgi:hypothetical protein
MQFSKHYKTCGSWLASESGGSFTTKPGHKKTGNHLLIAGPSFSQA